MDPAAPDAPLCPPPPPRPKVDICSHGGGAIPWDEASCSEGSPFYTAEAQAFMRDSAARAQVDATPALAQVLAGGIDCYHALFIPGGHGICFDGTSPEFKALVEAFWAAGKVVSGGWVWGVHEDAGARWLRAMQGAPASPRPPLLPWLKPYPLPRRRPPQPCATAPAA